MTIIKKGRQHYVVRVECGHDPATGRRLRIDRTVRGPRTEAEALESELKSQRNKGRLVMPSKATVQDILEEWLTVQRGNVAPRTYERFESIVRRALTPNLGSVRVCDLESRHIQTYYSECLERGLSLTTVKHRHYVLRAALQRAVGRYIVENPATLGDDKVKLPKRKRQKARSRAITVDQARQLLDFVAGSTLEVPVRVALDTGMRLSEILGLRWADVDFEKGSLKVNQTILELSKAGTGLDFTEPKTPDSIREIALDNRTLAFLKQHKRFQVEQKMLVGPAVWADHDLVVSNDAGEPVRPSTVSRHFGRASEKSGIGCRFHDLRHTHATLALANGMHVNDVSKRLGHSDPSFTYREYSHETQEGNQRIASVTADLIYGAAEAL